MRQAIKKCQEFFFIGFLVYASLAFGFTFLYKGFQTLDKFGNTLISYVMMKLLRGTAPVKNFTGLGFACCIVIFFIIGIIAKKYLKRFLVNAAETFFSQMANLLSKFVKVIIRGFQKKHLFEKAVLIEFPNSGQYCIGFIMQHSQDETLQSNSENIVVVLVPTTPKINSGFLIFVPSNKITELSLNVEDAIKLIISAGVIPLESHSMNQIANLIRNCNKGG